ncbi:ABC transporter ATP-binding protein [Qingshengfaniella alkalisoli]|uniref:ABC transporter ATP-binding protein n=1 Tax=Qingshengfaniella alkalisoli TaxID=2599296 RepID=A0A5B8J180_9RHOB|nr:ABC transporter ATP-binding protein [Qingshengfaniella alkalisoli]QDY68267.1 ABC transporter ATP-binding protein [Qingshengfaniella alkalisoli]
MTYRADGGTNEPARESSAHWGKGLSALVRITRLTLRYPVQFTIAVLATVVAAVLQLSIPRLLGTAIDQTQTIVIDTTNADAHQQQLLNTALILLAVAVARGLFTMLQNYFAESVGHHVGYNLRVAYYDKIQRLNFAFHDRTHSGELITKGMLDLEGVRMYFSTAFIRTILLVLLIGAGAYLLISTDVILGLLALSFVPFVAWRSSVTQLRLRATWLALQDRLAILSRVMEENLGGIRVVRAFAGQLYEMAKFDRASHSALDLAHERVALRVRNSSAMTFSFFAAMGLVLWIGGRKVLAGDISVGTLAEFLTFMTILQMPVRQLGLMVNAFARASTCGGRLFEVLDLDIPIKDAPGATPLEITDGTLRFENVSFAFDGNPREVLRNLSFEAKRGQTIGIVGPPGSGKSTLVNLIPRFYDVDSGRVTIDGQDVRDVALESLRNEVSVVQQDSFLFTTTIGNNIAYADPWAHDKSIRRAADSAKLHSYIMGLPVGYETVVGERGVSLSGGQRQRMAIAQMLLRRPAIMVFDDSTAAIDAGTEQQIRAAMRDYSKDRVTIVVAHRLSSLMHADQILFMEDGQIVERGSHEELLSQGGRYKALYDLQVRPGEED